VFGQRLDAATGAEVGGDDFRLSDMGDSGSTAYAAFQPRVAWSAATGEYLVVWRGDDNVGGLANNELEVFGQRLDEWGIEVGANDFRISQQGGTGTTAAPTFNPTVAPGEGTNAWLVTWDGEPPMSGAEIFGQYLDPQGNELGADAQLSDMGSNARSATVPAVAYGDGPGQFLVVWQGDDEGVVAPGELEIFGQRMGGTAALLVDGFESGDTAAWSASWPP